MVGIRPLGDRVVIKMVETEETTKISYIHAKEAGSTIYFSTTGFCGIGDSFDLDIP